MVALRKRIRRSLRTVVHNTVAGTEIYPFERIWVRLKHLKDYVGIGIPYRYFGRIRFGTWDQQTKPFQNSWRAQCCRLHWIEGQIWEETGAYRHLAAELANNADGEVDGCRNHEDIVRRYERLDALYELAKARGLPSIGTMIDGRTTERDAILVHVARDGRLLVGSGGAHRLAMAQCLNLDRIPAGLGVIHGLAARRLLYRRTEAARCEDWYIG